MIENLFITCLLLGVSSVAGQFCSSPVADIRYWNNGNFNGGDIEATNQPTLEDCMDRCIANVACNAFTYDTTNSNPDNCWLKTKSASTNDMNDYYLAGSTSGLRCNFQPFEALTNPADGMYPLEDIPEVIWGVDSVGDIFRRHGIEGTWESINGALTQVTTGPMGVFGINTSGQVLYRRGTHKNQFYAGSDWQLLESSDTWTYISSGLTEVLCINDAEEIFFLENIELQGDDISFTWTKIDGVLNQISANGVNEAIWGVSSTEEVFYKANLLAPWQNVLGFLKQVEVGEMGVFGVDANNEIWYRLGTNENSGDIGTGWQKLPGLLKHISVGTNNVWGVTADDEIYSMENITFVSSEIQFSWKLMEGSLKQIAVISSPPLLPGDQVCSLQYALVHMQDMPFVSEYNGYQINGSTEGSIIQQDGTFFNNLGTFEGVNGTVSSYSGGTYCAAADISRSLTIIWSCGLEMAITNSTEPSTCIYVFHATLPCCDFQEVNECTTGVHNCDNYATCEDTIESFTCTCAAGSTGDGVSCTDIDECTDETHSCDAMATCTNELWSYSCTCQDGYIGDGVNCQNMCPSTDCWEWNNSTSECDIKTQTENCNYTITCLPDGMTVSFPVTLFDSTEDSNFENPESDEMSEDCDPSWDLSSNTHEWTKPLGTCGQTLARSDGKILIEKSFTLHKATTGRRSASQIYTAPMVDFSQISVTFACSFESDTTATISNITINPYYVADNVTATNDSSLVSDGSWDGTVSLTPFISADFLTELDTYTESLFVGTPMFIRAAWNVDTLTDLVKFYLRDCIVEDVNRAEFAAKIIDQSCYAQAAGAKPLGPAGTDGNGTKIVSTNADFGYNSFSFEAAAAQPAYQRLTCTVQFCIVSGNGTDCDKEIVNPDEGADCPTTAGFGFSPRGTIDLA